MLGLKIAVGIFAGLVAAQSMPPSCSLNCFQKAIAETSCGILDFHCQCTEGADIITASTVECLCESEACSDSELQEVRDYSNNVCEQALEDDDDYEFEPVTFGPDVCAAGIPAATASGTVGAGGADATATAGATSEAAASATDAAATASGSAEAFEGAGVRAQSVGVSTVGLMALVAAIAL
ncbi:hypothetical protein MBLNU230_g4233t1 [Neophaeotheca triangularis]